MKAELQADQQLTSAEVFRPLVRGTPPDGGVASAAFCAAIGLLWIGTWVWLLLLALANESPVASMIVCLLGITLGMGAMASQVPHLALALWFRRPRASIAAEALDTDGAFTFRYSQRVIKPVEAELTCSLVLRETLELTPVDGARPPATSVDHLVDSHRGRSVAWHPGDLLLTGCKLSVPQNPERRFALGSGRLSWIMKVRVRLPDQRDFWEEFRLPFGPQVVRREVTATSQTPRRFSLVVLRIPDWFWPERTPEALLEVSPHLHRLTRLPVRALETLSREEAERACRRLEAAGISVALYCDDQPIQRSTLHNLPIPQLDSVLAIEDLPIPTPTAFEVAEEGRAAIETQSRVPATDPVRLKYAG